jgi:hypothetical protein
MADFDLQGLLASFDPTEEQKRAARMAAITQLGLGLLGTRKGDEFLRLGEAGTNAMAGYGHALNDIPRQKMERMAAAGQAMGLQEKVRQFADEDQARKILMGGAPQGMGGGPPQGVPFGMGDHSSGMAPPMGPPPMGPAAAPKGLYEQLLAKADALEQGGLPQKAQEYRMLAEKYAPKYKGTETVMKNGKPVLLQQYENQAPSEMGYQPKPDYKEVNMGDQKMFFDPLTQANGGIFRMNQSPDSAASNQVAMRGQNMTDARAREMHADAQAMAGKPQIVTNPQTGEMYAVDPRTASGQQVMGPDNKPLSKGEKPLTESQGNATAFGMRMKAANDLINGLEDKGFPVSSPMNKLTGNPVTNYLMPSDAQNLQQAKLNFMSASLRKESGAAISQSEYDAEDKKYFPQPGDKPEAIAQKRSMRALALRAMGKQAGNQGAREFQGVSIDDLVKKYTK